jgi:hypothetical protein
MNHDLQRPASQPKSINRAEKGKLDFKTIKAVIKDVNIPICKNGIPPWTLLLAEPC